ncbi:hypothetical protein SSU05_0192 [Streptococcus suis 05ZYH33]|nr:hypothetical protein SSU05_0192 [Streptococcus suis 05ZYH33]
MIFSILHSLLSQSSILDEGLQFLLEYGTLES